MTPILHDVHGAEIASDDFYRFAQTGEWRGGVLFGLGGGVVRPGDVIQGVTVRGTAFYRDAILAALSSSEPLEISLEAEPDNAHDPFAIIVHLNGRKVGYVPKEVAIAWQAKVISGDLEVRAMTRPQTLGEGFRIGLLCAWPDGGAVRQPGRRCAMVPDDGINQVPEHWDNIDQTQEVAYVD